MEQNKAMNIRIPKELWSFGKKKAIDREMSFNQLVIELLEKYKKKCDKKVDDQ